ncbi:MAG: oxygen-independent coproporphyrinogen III oxidase-like protein [Betaproteobacteria bacterium]|nr:oxygen-independent coproporphyrinogen III oxidase-like protein [Betaproteobacteria bacterium]
MQQSIVTLFGGKTGGVQFTVPLPLALYIHLPWCLKKCPYCDFNSHELRRGVDAQAPAGGFDTLERDYVAALLADLESALPLVWGRSVQTVFIGGGTPSLFSPAAIEVLLAGVRARIKLAPDAEITLEANPGTFEAGRFAGYRAAGVTRLSIGVQSFNDDMLKVIGRVHDSAQARAAVHEAARNFSTFNLDLMFALPGQSLAQCEADLAAALAFAPPHLSVYHLTLEPNTLFARFPPVVPDDDAAAAMQDRITDITQAAGYGHYEVSAYAQPGHRCRHNLNYWQFGDYLGIGAGAHGKLSFASRIVRHTRWRHPATYMQRALEGQAVETEHEVAAADVPFEFMLNALRLHDGFAPALFTERCGLPLAVAEPALREAERKGLLERTPELIRPTPLGQRFLNDLQQVFLNDAT